MLGDGYSSVASSRGLLPLLAQILMTQLLSVAKLEIWSFIAQAILTQVTLLQPQRH
jgi:hypothetical protein